MRYDNYALNVATGATGAGTPKNCADLVEKYVQIFGTFAATVSVEASADGTNFSPVGTSVTAPGWVPVPMGAKQVRINVTAYTSGQAIAVLSGDTRST